MSILDQLVEISISFLPSMTLLAVFIWTYFRGRHVNQRIFKKEFASIEKAFSSLVKSWNLVNENLVSQTYQADLTNEGKKIMKDFQMHFSLEERQNIISFLIRIFSGPKDFIIFEANPIKRPLFSLEIISKENRNQMENNKELQSRLKEMVSISVKKRLDKLFYFKRSDTDASNKGVPSVLSDSTLLKTLIAQGHSVHRLSLDKSKYKEYIKSFKEYELEKDLDDDLFDESKSKKATKDASEPDEDDETIDTGASEKENLNRSIRERRSFLILSQLNHDDYNPKILANTFKISMERINLICGKDWIQKLR